MFGKTCLKTKKENEHREEMFRIKNIGEKGEDLSKYVIVEMIKKYSEAPFPFSVQCILGEFTSTYILKESINAENCEKVEILMGPKFRSRKTREDIKIFLEEAKQKNRNIILLRIPIRPKNHGIRIGNSLFIEDNHPLDENYEWATVVPNASEESIKIFQNNYDSLYSQPREPVTLENIDKIDSYFF